MFFYHLITKTTVLRTIFAIKQTNQHGRTENQSIFLSCRVGGSLTLPQLPTQFTRVAQNLNMNSDIL